MEVGQNDQMPLGFSLRVLFNLILNCFLYLYPRYMRGERPAQTMRVNSYPVSCQGLEMMQVG